MKALRSAVVFSRWGLLLIPLGIYFSWDLITYQKAFLHPDYYAIYYQFRVWFVSSLIAGEFPLWNSSWGLGHPAAIWASVPLDFFTFLELIFGPQYGIYQSLQVFAVLVAAYIVFVWIGVPAAAAAAIAGLFLLSPWTNYFFF